MLNFIGIGSAFHTELGNTSAYIKKEDSLVLIDCGGTVFHQINELNLLNKIKDLHIIITHTHPDHIGSLGEVIFYAYFILKIKAHIYFPDRLVMETLFHVIGVEKQMVVLHDEKVHAINDLSIHLSFLEVSHTKTLKAYGFYLTMDEKKIYYSGDSNNIPTEVIDKLKKKEIDFLYQDTCGIDYDGNAHLSLSRLQNYIDKDLRNYVYCIHLDKHIDLEQMNELGFRIPNTK